MKFVESFKPTDVQVLVTLNDNEVVACYTSEFKGKTYFHLRTLYKTGEIWNPGKGVSVLIEHKDTLCSALGKLAKTKKKEAA